ncbi:hypothetical protein NEF87_003622 [Candidatus Lokiarchaeum ossiferum]|uniref:PIN domain-containing protein n=1 Tax=Candidatus Lokiarchaeum ossiferum TaxID=2951803 RepID=A0ABY6HWX2_9ARCH|nr:hypothetical protein NEF87_003622 [Candidatus Lokiarchaeum sp. B-35]
MVIYLFLDANFILIPAQFKVDIYSEFERLIPKPWEIILVSAIFSEIEYKITRFSQKTKLKRQYLMARQLLTRQSYRLIKKERTSDQIVDDLLLEVALEFQELGGEVYLCTNDKELREKCHQQEIKTVFLRQEKFLDVE